MFERLKQVADDTPSPRGATITLLDEARRAVLSWKLCHAQPKKRSGSQLTAAAGALAMEELALVREGLEME